MESLRVEGSLMFARLLVCVGLLAFPCFGLVGCGDEDPVSSVEGDEAPVSSLETVPEDDVVVREVAKLVKTIPASGEDAAELLPLVLYFDKEPLAVTVNGTAARVRGNTASWCFPNPTQKLGDQLFHIEWTNPDGSPNVGTNIRLTVLIAEFTEPVIVSGSVSDREADVDPDPLNRDGIWFSFDDPVIVLKFKLLAEDGEGLGWEAVWDDQTLIFHPGASGKLLENGRRYMIQMAVSEPWIYNEISCECMDCSHYKNPEWTIGFITVDK